MGLINNKFRFTFTDDESDHPVVSQTIDFTDDSGDNYTSSRIQIPPGLNVTWQQDTEITIMDVSALLNPWATYIIIQPEAPIYVWFGAHPQRDLSGNVNETVSPEIRVDKLMVVEGPANTGVTNTIYAINPSRTLGTNITATVNITFVYAD